MFRNPVFGAIVFFSLGMVLHVRWPWLLLIAGATYVHEFGHAVVARMCGIRVIGIRFGPLGAIAVFDGPIPSRVEPAILLAGPLIGLLPAAVAAGMYLASGDPRCAGFVAFVCAMSLFSLVPIASLDGGRLVNELISSVSITLALAWTGASTFVLVATTALDPRFLPFGAIVLFLTIPQIRSLLARATTHHRIIRSLARAYHVPADASAILEAWQTSTVVTAMTIVAGRQPRDSAGDDLWNEMDITRRDAGRPGIREIIEKLAAVSPRLTPGMAAAWFVAYLGCIGAIWYCMTLANRIMPLTTFMGIITHR